MLLLAESMLISFLGASIIWLLEVRVTTGIAWFFDRLFVLSLSVFLSPSRVICWRLPGVTLNMYRFGVTVVL